MQISFEFFPPKTEVGAESLKHTAAALATYRPDYFSVTYGASGGNRERTIQTVLALKQQHLPVVPHLSCMGTSEQDILSLLSLYQKNGFQKLVILRGDKPKQEHKQAFYYANELVEFIRAHTGNFFKIFVAAYPEFHPESTCAETCLQHFKKKVLAGANGALTQYFFNIEAYDRYVESCATMGIFIPIIPGIMPITDVAQLLRFSQFCGADIPIWLRKRLQVYQDKPASLMAFGIDVVTRLCEQLRQRGVPGLHFYTLNKQEPICSILAQLGIRINRKVVS